MPAARSSVSVKKSKNKNKSQKKGKRKMASGRNSAAKKIEQNVPARREPARQLRVAPSPSKRHRRNTGVQPGVYACFAIAAIAAAFILFSQMQLTQLTAEASEQSDLLSELQSENVALTTKQMNSMNMDEVEQYATGTLGMVKLDNSQVEYVELTNPDMVTVAENGVSLRAAVSALVDHVLAIVEYIR